MLQQLTYDTNNTFWCQYVVVVCRRTEEDLFSLFQVKQSGVDKVDLWMTNSLLLPLTVKNASLSQKLQGVLKVCMHHILM